MLTQLSPDLIGVSVPIGANSIKISKVKPLCLLWEELPNIVSGEKLHEGNWQILGYVTKDEVSFDVEPYVDSHDKCTFNDLKLYPDYINPHSSGFHFVGDSFRSLITSKGIYFVNPYGEKEPDILCYESVEMYEYDLQQWQTAQSKVAEKVIILNKV